MRIFVALELPEHVIKGIDDWQEPLRFLHPSLKWVRFDRMHLTLRYFGNINGEEILPIEELLSSWKPGNLEFTIDKIGTFGRGKRLPSVYWLGGVFPDAVSSIAGELGMIPDDRGRTDRKTFFPHITIARRRDSSASPVLPEPFPLHGMIREAIIFNSRLTPAGPEYSSLNRFNLH